MEKANLQPRSANLVVISRAYLQMRGLFYKPYEPILSIARPDTVLRLQSSVGCIDLLHYFLNWSLQRRLIILSKLIGCSWIALKNVFIWLVATMNKLDNTPILNFLLQRMLMLTELEIWPDQPPWLFVWFNARVYSILCLLKGTLIPQYILDSFRFPLWIQRFLILYRKR